MSEATGGNTSPGEDLARLHLWQIQPVRDAAWIAAAIALVWLGYAMRSVTVPLLLALLLAYLFEPLVARACVNWNARRPVVVAALVCSIIVVLVLCVAIAVPLIVGQTVQMVRDLRTGRLEHTMLTIRRQVPETMLGSYDTTAHSIAELVGTRYRPPQPKPAPATTTAPAEAGPDTQPATGADVTAFDEPPPIEDQERLRELIRTEVALQLESHIAQQPATSPTNANASDPSRAPIGSIWQMSRATAEAIFGFLGKVLQIGFLFFLIPFYLFFFSLWYPQIVEFGRGLIPKRNEARALELLGKMDRVIAGFVRGRIVISLIIGVICAIGWWIVGVPYAIVLGLITGIFSAVPYLGGVGLPIAIILLWVDQLGEPTSQRMSALAIIGGPTLVFVIMQVLETYLITPAIAGKATNLDPVTILVAVLAGGSVGGVYGMLLAIPVAACLKILLTDVLMPRVRLWVKGRAEDPLPL